MNRGRIPVCLCYCSVCIALLLLAVGCDLPGKPEPADRPILPDEVTNFDALYSTHCAGCHGATGEYGPAPPLNDPLFVAIISDDVLQRVIHSGRVGTPMPPFATVNGGSLTSQQIDVLVGGIKQKWGTAESGTDAAPPYELTRPVSGQASPDELRRGQQVFASACAGCHGKHGRGEPSDSLLAGPINVPAFLALMSDQALRRIIITGRTDLGMPDFAATDGRPDDFQPLTSAEVDDLVSLLADWRKQGNDLNTDGTSLSSLLSQ